MSLTFKNSFWAALALLACLVPAAAQESIIGGGVYRPRIGNRVIFPLMSIYSMPTSGVANIFYGPVGAWNAGSGASGSAIKGIPIPVAGTVSGLVANSAGSLSTLTVQDVINGAAGTLTCPPVTAGTPCSDPNHTDTVNAGDTIQVEWLPGAGPWPAQSGYSMTSLMVQSASTAGGMLMYTGVTGTTVNTYVGPGTGANPAFSNATDAQASAIMPVAGTITGLYVIPNATASATAQQIFTVCLNGTTACSTPTGPMHCQLVSGSNVGCCVTTGAVSNVGGTTACATNASPITFAAGDTISVQINCATANCGNIAPGISLAYTPTVIRQAIVSSQIATTLTPQYLPTMGSLISTTQTTSQITPLLPAGTTLTWSNPIACASQNPGGSASRTVAWLGSANSSTLPTSQDSVTFAVGNACPGNMSAALPGGKQDTTTTWTQLGGTLIGINESPTGSPVGGTTSYKYSVVAVIH